jgi:hypothetical protein
MIIIIVQKNLYVYVTFYGLTEYEINTIQYNTIYNPVYLSHYILLSCLLTSQFLSGNRCSVITL